jgi:xanthine dehydrogenase YagR molybdenum-binding subunit
VVEHYHQAIALVVAETFEQARAAAQLVQVTYARTEGAFDLAHAKASTERRTTDRDNTVGDFAGAFAKAEVRLDARPTARPTTRTR